ncbi:hypothetical protein V6N12_065233 [Hibiscus sabdariffa]|uniref:RNase H type-1 domain-containing protein n=1 Tax=Hibiscus sabdariffa TaxID=183260 RepID=A0ABR2G8G6_9ROSI
MSNGKNYYCFFRVFDLQTLIETGQDADEAKWLEVVWRGVAPSKVETFTWLAIHGRIPARLASWYKAKYPLMVISNDSLIFDPSLADKVSSFTTCLNSKIVWKPPHVGFLKLNVDGAVSKNGLGCGVGGLLRNNYGECLMSFSEQVGQGPPILAKLQAMKIGLLAFLQSRWYHNHRLILESDSKIAVEWMLNVTLCSSIFAGVVHEIKDLMHTNCIVVQHITRGGNVEADTLAKRGIAEMAPTSSGITSPLPIASSLASRSHIRFHLPLHSWFLAKATVRRSLKDFSSGGQRLYLRIYSVEGRIDSCLATMVHAGWVIPGDAD